MKIRHFEDQRTINLELLPYSDTEVFHQVAAELSHQFSVKWKEKVDGLDQQYWDFEYKDVTFTLHLDYLGIMIYIHKDNPKIESGKKQLQEFGKYFEKFGG